MEKCGFAELNIQLWLATRVSQRPGTYSHLEQGVWLSLYAVVVID